MSEYYIGLMSGTSLDGVDGVLVELQGARMQLRGHAFEVLQPALRTELLALNDSAGNNELHRAAVAANGLVRVYAKVVASLLQNSNIPAQELRAIGAHGQTVRHQPGLRDGVGYTLQLNNPALLAELTGVTVVADFRSRDLAAGGQGAPLAPAFHQAVFGQESEPLAVLNLGGIANLSLLQGSQVLGFDCGPGNVLLDAWCHLHTEQAYDNVGRWAASGQVHAGLLQALLAEPYFSLPPPKSTGRDLFGLAWLDNYLAAQPIISAVDVQATLAELTARCCADALQHHAPASARLLVCGGGACNAHLMQRLQALLPGLPVLSTAAVGWPPLQVEAAAFAWLASKALAGQPGNLPSVTGARGPRVLGAIYPA